MKNFPHVLLSAIMLFLFAGCGVLGDGRQQYHKDIRVEEEKTKQEFMKAKKVEIEAKKTQKTNPTLRVTTYQADGKTVASVIEADIAPVIEASHGGNRHDSTYGVDISKTASPRGEAAEILDATGNLIQKAGSSPAVVAGTVGHFMKEVTTDAGKTEINGETVSIDGSMNRTEIHNTGTGELNHGTATPPDPFVVEVPPAAAAQE